MQPNTAYRTLLFDLDGTITDSAPGILRCFRETLPAFGIDVPDDATLRRFVGPPLEASFRACGLEGNDIARAVARYREIYWERGMLDCAVYEGIPALLGDLKGAGYRVALATSKMEALAAQILRHFGLAEHFSFIGGSLETSRRKKTDVIDYVLGALGCERAAALMIGDTAHDLTGAASSGIDAVGVTYSYCTRSDLEPFPHVAILDSVEALRRYLLA